jgi:hypothetical protein
VTPNPDAIFSPLLFSNQTLNGQAVNPKTLFFFPVGHVYAVFSYNNMTPESQWTALWIHQGELVFFETKPWDGVEGGWGYTDWDPAPGEWKSGEYQIQIFVGEVFKVEGRFIVDGDPLTTVSPTNPAQIPTNSPQPLPTRTP